MSCTTTSSAPITQVCFACHATKGDAIKEKCSTMYARPMIRSMVPTFCICYPTRP
ncbi:hypothetical protein BOTBODRAFT_36856 [Botryobasidium botryosum FD-172 SS1]|uniref:Uncharacterized protein n=1 Tax=Botryobasidium botryosum (strain FD-172 SS1) TaxID=930990 RepID=A0A067M1G4_BOTB1|nr:hypothetical protein BOTBODRAFT_36856 [Botryobasidium botryosum FD-172 SS1]